MCQGIAHVLEDFALAICNSSSSICILARWYKKSRSSQDRLVSHILYPLIAIFLQDPAAFFNCYHIISRINPSPHKPGYTTIFA